MWNDIISLLRGEYRCIAFDFPGHRRSAPVGDYGIEALTDIVAARLETLGVVPCHFVGFSLGSFVALRLALRREKPLLRSLTLIGTSAGREPFMKRLRYRYLAWQVRRGRRESLLLALRDFMFSPRHLADPGRGKQAEAWLRAVPDDVVYQCALAVIDRQSVTSLLCKVTVPTLVLHATGDKVRTKKESEAIFRGVAAENATYAQRKGAGHMLPVEDPAWVASQVAGFLSNLPVRTPTN
jgi:pimeloyl-ACP methyl ester carboxylesterase